MPLFRRTRAPQTPAADAVPACRGRRSRWWTTEGARHCVHLLDSGNAPAVERVLGPAVSRVDPDPAWETGPASDAGRLLVVTAAGDPRLRPTTRRWLRAAPAPDGCVVAHLSATGLRTLHVYADRTADAPVRVTGRRRITATVLMRTDVVDRARGTASVPTCVHRG